jgi:pyruvate/2-oxoglutarate dehydrogenase complex dihydrolipoamide acyltransferase (E2) component
MAMASIDNISKSSSNELAPPPKLTRQTNRMMPPPAARKAAAVDQTDLLAVVKSALTEQQQQQPAEAEAQQQQQQQPAEAEAQQQQSPSPTAELHMYMQGEILSKSTALGNLNAQLSKMQQEINDRQAAVQEIKTKMIHSQGSLATLHAMTAQMRNLNLAPTPPVSSD